MIPKKRQKRKLDLDEIISISILLLLNLIIISFLIVGNWKLYQKRESLKKDIVDLKEEVSLLERQNEQLREMFFQASQAEYLEKIIREKGLYKKPGEEVVVILKENQAPSNPATFPEKENLLQKIINFFKNLFGR